MYYKGEKVYCLLDGQQFMYYGRFDKNLNCPVEIKNTLNVRRAKVEKSNQSNARASRQKFEITVTELDLPANKKRSSISLSALTGNSGGRSKTFDCVNTNVSSSWYSALTRATLLHEEQEKRVTQHNANRALLNLPIYGFKGTSDADLSKAKIAKAYKLMAMKCHPDRGGDIEQFNKINEAYVLLLLLLLMLIELCHGYLYEPWLSYSISSGALGSQP